MITLRGTPGDEAWCTRLRTDVAQALLDTGAPGLAINVRDAVVNDSLMTLTTLDPPVIAFVSIWTDQCYGEQIHAATTLLSDLADQVAAYLVTESVPLSPPRTDPGERTPGFANVALLRRPAELDEATWLARWHDDHTQVAIDTQSTFGYTQNAVVRPLTEGVQNWKAPWTQLVRRRSAQWGAILAGDETLRQVQVAPQFYRGASTVGNSAVLYEKTAGSQLP